MTLPFVIAFNGPPKIGKGWIAQNLKSILPFHTKILSFAEPLRQNCFDATRWEDRSPEGYARFKETDFEGETGREMLIRIGNGMRAQDIHYWSRQLTDSREYLYPEGQIVLIDDLGFADEQAWLENNSSGFATVVIAPTHYSIGSQWEGDSRFCLVPQGGFRTMNSTLALESFRRRLENAQSHQSTNIDSRFNWFFALMAGPLGEQSPGESVRHFVSDSPRIPMVGEEHGES